MTFKQFEDAVKTFRDDVIVSKHGDFCNNKSGNTLGVIFVGKDGRKSKVYDYSGTYEQILCKLKIPAVTRSTIKNVERALNECKEKHGKKRLLFIGEKNEFVDFSNEIKEYEEALKRYNEMYIIEDVKK